MHFAVGIDALISLFGVSDNPQKNTLILGLQVPHKGYIIGNIEQADIFMDCLQKTLFAKNILFAKKTIVGKVANFHNDGLMKRLLGKVGRGCSNPRQDTRSRRAVMCETKSYQIY